MWAPRGQLHAFVTSSVACVASLSHIRSLYDGNFINLRCLHSWRCFVQWGEGVTSPLSQFSGQAGLMRTGILQRRGWADLATHSLSFVDGKFT